MLIRDQIRARDLPPLLPDAEPTVENWEKRREELKTILLREEYGFLPDPPLKWEVEEPNPAGFSCAGNAMEHHPVMHLTLSDGTPFSFPFHFTMPTKGLPCPAVLHVNFRNAVPDRYMPVEELVDHGFAVFSFCYNDVTSDNGDFTDKLAGVFYKGRDRNPTDPGKISLWSWAAQRICDYMMTLPELDKSRFAVAGHSRLGKTALLSGALDPRFTYVISNCAGCSGDSPMRGKVPGNERVRHIVDRFPYWFCPNYAKYVDNESAGEFDQHDLLALTAPRFLLIGSAAEDAWADQIGQYQSAVAAGDAWRIYGVDPGLPEDVILDRPTEFNSGAIGFHFREGRHFFSRADWGAYMRFIEKHPASPKN